MNIVCWAGRILALGLFLFWGAFFVEHLQEWFMHPAKGFPPVWVCLAQLAHLTVLIGLLALWRWQLTGSVLTILGSLAFFGGLAISQAIAGKHYLTMMGFLAVTLIPALLTLACWFARTRALAVAGAPLTGIDLSRLKRRVMPGRQQKERDGERHHRDKQTNRRKRYAGFRHGVHPRE